MKSKTLRYAVGLLVTGLALWLSFRNLDWGALRDSFYRVDFFWVAAAVVNSLATVYVLGWRWHTLLKSRVRMSPFYLFQLNIISQYINIVIPGRFGELARAWLPARRYDLSGSYVLGTVVIEKMFDFFAWVVLWVSVPALFAFQDRVRGYSTAVVVGVVLVVMLVVMIWKRELLRRWFGAFARLMPRRFGDRLADFMDRGLEAFTQLKQSRTILMMVLYTALVIMLSSLTNFLLFLAFDFKLSFFEAVMLLLVIQVGNAPPSVPGKIGIFEYMVILGLSFFSIGKADAMGYALMLHVIAYLPKIILGFIFTGTLRFSLEESRAQLDRLEQTAAQESK